MHTLAKPRNSQTIKYAASRANAQRGSTDLSKPSYPPVESIQRAMTVLRAVNSFRIATVNDINSATKYPKSSIVRVLETLVVEGYVARDNLCGGYRVTSRAIELCVGYQGISSLIECARPHTVALTNRIKWPVSIGLLAEDAMAIRFSTAPISPLADVQLLGQRLELFSSPMGRAYLAFCDDEEREGLIAKIRSPDPSEAKEGDWRLRTILRMVRDEGFALGGGASLDSSIALPIFDAGGLAAIVSLEYYDSVVPREEIREKLIAPLLETVRGVETALSESGNRQLTPLRAGCARERYHDAIRSCACNCGQFEASPRHARGPPCTDTRKVMRLNIGAE